MQIAFIGLGNMGGPMAINLHKAGHSVKAFDLSQDALAKVKAEGLQVAASAQDAVQGAEKAAIDTAVSGADPHAMVEALANAELVLDAAVTIRDKVVEAYQELLRMPV